MNTTAENTALEPSEARIENLLKDMTLEEKVSLLAGANFWETVAIPRLGIPSIKVSDGPNGARGSGSLAGSKTTAACFPVGVALASSWDTDLITEVGVALGQEAKTKGAQMLLAPTVNIHRSPLNGRNFECYSEDPYLTARMAVGYITGLQSQKVGATVKHFVCNDSEFQRNTISSDLDERTLREIYLPPFLAAVQDAKTWGVMSSYNKINGVHADGNAVLLNDILKTEWGFTGIVMSDWTGTNSTVDAANNGLDLEMPGPAKWRGEKLLEVVRSGEVKQEAIDEAARRMLRVIQRVGAFEHPHTEPEQAVDRPEHRALIRRAATESTVLLKNANHILPLEQSALKSIAVIGPNAKTAQIMGGGSAQVSAHYIVTPFDGLKNAVGDGVNLGYEIGCTNHKLLPRLEPKLVKPDGGDHGFKLEYYNNHDLSGAAAYSEIVGGSEQMIMGEVAPGVDLTAFSARMTTSFTPEQSGTHHFSLMSVGKVRLFVNDAELIDNWMTQTKGESYFGFGTTEVQAGIEMKAGQTYRLRLEYNNQDVPFFAAFRLGYLPPVAEDAIERAAKLAAQSDIALVFVGTNGDWESEGHDRADLELPGEQAALIERVAAANPNTVVVLQTGSPITMPWLEKVAGVIQAWFPGQECGNAIADVLFGAVNPSGKLTQTYPLRLQDNPAFINYPGENGHVRYGEGIFVGYRYYDKKDVAPLFPFGFGLSYSSFSYKNLRLSTDVLEPNQRLSVSVDVTNTGKYSGQEIVQLYVHDVECSVSRPPKELKGFAKVLLEPGETKTVTLHLEREALAYWDDVQHTWVAEAGEFEVLIGSSSQDIQALGVFKLTETVSFDGPSKTV
jgi:beta-glucosidase